METKKESKSLSDERKDLSNYGLENTESLGGAVKFYTEEKVKQAIKKLKELYAKQGGLYPGDIDKIFGEKLI